MSLIFTYNPIAPYPYFTLNGVPNVTTLGEMELALPLENTLTPPAGFKTNPKPATQSPPPIGNTYSPN